MSVSAIQTFKLYKQSCNCKFWSIVICTCRLIGNASIMLKLLRATTNATDFAHRCLAFAKGVYCAPVVPICMVQKHYCSTNAYYCSTDAYSWHARTLDWCVLECTYALYLGPECYTCWTKILDQSEPNQCNLSSNSTAKADHQLYRSCGKSG